jgi:membrane protease YdiL (CAAX protease family)
VVGVLVGGLAAGGLSALALRGSGLAGRQSIGWVSASRRSLFFAGIAGAALAGLYLVAAAYIPEPPGRSFGPVTSAVAGGGSARHLWALLAMVLAPPIEEFVFRGVLFGGLSRSWSPAPAGALVTLIFVCAHLGEVSGHPTAIAWVGVLGIVLLWVRVRTGSLLPGVVLHGFYNLVLVIAVYAGTT